MTRVNGSGPKTAPPTPATEPDGFHALANLLGTYRKQLLDAGIPEAETVALLAAAQTQFIAGLAASANEDQSAIAPSAERLT